MVGRSDSEKLKEIKASVMKRDAIIALALQNLREKVELLETFARGAERYKNPLGEKAKEILLACEQLDRVHRTKLRGLEE